MISSDLYNTELNSVEFDYITANFQETPKDDVYTGSKYSNEEFHDGMHGKRSNMVVDEMGDYRPEVGMPGRIAQEEIFQTAEVNRNRDEVRNINTNFPHGRRPAHGHPGMPGGIGNGSFGAKNNYGMNINNQIPTDQNKSSRSFGILGVIFNSAYEILTFVFIGGIIYNCCFGINNDKYSQIWYNANKEYLEKRYETVGYKSMVKKDEEDHIEPTKFNMVKENAYIFKLICYNYRYIKALLILLEVK